MNKLITINYLSHTRPEYSDLTFHYLENIKNENKNKIKLNVLSSVENDWSDKCDKLGIEYSVHVISGGNNYLPKLNIALNSNTKYSIKLDEDCFINNHIWDYMIENVGVLDNDDNLLVSPIMTNNIPSCDLFIDNAIKDSGVVNKVKEFLISRPMPNGLWGVNYEPLNKYTIGSKSWDYKQFYNGVRELGTEIMGIHPIRICYEAQVEINEYILNNPSIITDNNDYSLTEFEAPYFTNSLFLIKTSVWRDVINTPPMDAFDEISLNNYKSITNKKIMFINNGFGLHLLYNTIYGNKNRWGIGMADGELYEKSVYERLITKIKNN